MNNKTQSNKPMQDIRNAFDDQYTQMKESPAKTAMEPMLRWAEALATLEQLGARIK